MFTQKIVALASAIALVAAPTISAAEACMHDQTRPEVLLAIIANEVSPESDTGICHFLLNAPHLEDQKYHKAWVEGLTYPECTERAEQAVSFKWFPSKMYDINDIEGENVARCDGGCSVSPPICSAINCYCSDIGDIAGVRSLGCS